MDSTICARCKIRFPGEISTVHLQSVNKELEMVLCPTCMVTVYWFLTSEDIIITEKEK